jgi:aspartate-semialdehyde dehydrogenase
MPRIGVVGATGVVGRVVLQLLAQRGYDDVRAFASARSAGSTVDGLTVEEATPDALSAGNLDLCLFSIGTGASKELVPHAVRGGAICVDKSAAFRLEPGIPLVVPEVNGDRAREHDGILANPNCSTIPLTLVLKPLHEAAGLRALRVATYQSKSGAGDATLQHFLAESPEEHDLAMDWDYDGEDFEDEAKLREETKKIMELPELPVSVTCVRVPVPVGHSESVWIETEEPLSPEQARDLLSSAPAVRLEDVPTPGKAAGGDEVLVGRIRRDPAAENGISLFLSCDNLRKGAALNGIQIAELVLSQRAVTAV